MELDMLKGLVVKDLSGKTQTSPVWALPSRPYDNLRRHRSV